MAPLSAQCPERSVHVYSAAGCAPAIETSTCDQCGVALSVTAADPRRALSTGGCMAPSHNGLGGAGGSTPRWLSVAGYGAHAPATMTETRSAAQSDARSEVRSEMRRAGVRADRNEFMQLCYASCRRMEQLEQLEQLELPRQPQQSIGAASGRVAVSANRFASRFANRFANRFASGGDERKNT